MTARTKAWTIVCLPMSTYRLNPIVRFRAYFGRSVVLTVGVTILIRIDRRRQRRLSQAIIDS